MQDNYFSSLVRTYLVAEIGVNHNGDIDLARRMILAAKQAGADAVKFQSYRADTLVLPGTEKVAYQRAANTDGESHLEMLRRLELGRQQQQDLAAFCGNAGVDFLSTPYDIESAQALLDLGVKLFKTASADIVDLPLQQFIARSGVPAMVATGMANLGEIESVTDIYAVEGNPNLLLLHCVSNYPCSDASLNLRAMNTLASAFGLPIGFSDHSEGSLAAVLSVALGAKVVEKHFTLDKELPGPDHRASSTPREFSELVTDVRRAETMLGSRRKERQLEECSMAKVSRKSLVLTRAMRAGERISADDLRLMRPGNGMPASELSKVVGMRIRNDREAMHQLAWSDLDA